MGQINVSAVQMNAKLGDKQANFEKVLNLLERDITSNTDIILLPEVWAVGWMPSLFRENAEELHNSETLKFLSCIAQKYNTWIIGGSFIRKDEEKYYNSCPVLNRNGELVAIYDKNHLFSYYGCDEDKFVTAGKNPVLVNIEGIKVGLTICYDIRFPEIYRAYRKSDADLFINSAAWGLKKPVPWECMTRSRAVENQTYMIALTQSGKINDEEWNIGHSRIIDYKGESINEIIDQKEGCITATLDLELMYNFRKKCMCIKDIKETYEVETV